MDTQAKEEQEERSLIPSLVAKDVLSGGFRDERRSCVITAGKTGVFFAIADDMRSGMKFSLEEWNQVVDFVDSQILAAHEDWVDWAQVPAMYIYVAADEDGTVFAFDGEPYPDPKYKEWFHKSNSGGQNEQLYGMTLPANISWEDSLRKRPGKYAE